MKKGVPIILALCIFLNSCITQPTMDYSYPLDGISKNANVATKDFITLGVIFVNSVEEIDSEGNHTGSKITHALLMREAVKLGADDILNVKIDVNEKESKEKGRSGMEITVITYTYTGMALAIKYTDAVQN